MDPDLFLKPHKFLSILTKYHLNTYYIYFLGERGDLRSALMEARMSDSDDFLKEIVNDEKMWLTPLTAQEKESKFTTLKNEFLKKQQKKVSDFFPILFNKTLVMLCTVFDIFLLDTIKVITRTKPEVLKLLAQDQDITIAEVIGSSSYEEVFDVIQNKVLDRFDFKGIEEKLKVFEKLGISEAQLFNLNPTLKVRYPNPKNFLVGIYRMRHDLVHRNILTLQTYFELSECNDFLSHLIIKWGGIEIRKHFNLTSDFILLADNKLPASYLNAL